MIRPGIQTFAFCSIVFTFAILASCSESLPPVNPPERILVANTTTSYAYTFSANRMRLAFTVQNVFDETLEERASLTGSIRIELARDPTYTKQLDVTVQNAQMLRAYNPSTHVLQISPGESIQFQQFWDFVDENGRDLRSEVFEYRNDPTCPGRMISKPERFVISGTFKVFEQSGVLNLGPQSVDFCHVNIFVQSNYCPPIAPDGVCSYLN